MTTIVRSTFRYLQNFLVTDHEQSLSAITHAQERIIRSPMIQCRKWMSQSILQTFLNFVKVTFKIGNPIQSIPLVKAIMVYNDLMNLILNVSQKKKILRDKKLSKQNLSIKKCLYLNLNDNSFIKILPKSLVSQKQQKKVKNQEQQQQELFK